MDAIRELVTIYQIPLAWTGAVFVAALALGLALWAVWGVTNAAMAAWRFGVREIISRFKRFTVTVALRYIVWAKRESSYIKHIRREVPAWFAAGENDPNRWMADGTEELLAVLSHHGHSGGSIGFALGFFKAMARFKPWGPLTGEEHEWSEPFDYDGTRQNKRCSHVFMDKDGNAYDSNGRVFHDGDNLHYTSRDSRVPVTFPYSVPEQPEIVDTTA